MYRKYYRDENSSGLSRFALWVLVIYIFAFISAMVSGDAMVVSKMIMYPLVVLLILWIWKMVKGFLRKKHLSKIYSLIESYGLDEYINNFLARFSFEDGKGDGWIFRNRKIDWDRINDLESYLLEKGIPLVSSKKRRDVFAILQSYIQHKEENITRESIKVGVNKFSSLSGKDFELLLVSLFDSMGYKTEHIGHSGDQGGDLIANKAGERILVQAKCYKDWSVGNEAVQQVVAAMKHYDCNKTMVVTTSERFTPEAVALARSNNTELISKDRLSELLLQYRKESWG